MEDLYMAKISDIYGYDFDPGVFSAYLTKKSNGFHIKKVVLFPSFLRDKSIILAEKESRCFRKVFYYEEFLTGVRFKALDEHSLRRFSVKTLEQFPLLFLDKCLNLKRLDIESNSNPYEYLSESKLKQLLDYSEIEEFMEYLNPSIKIYEELGFPRTKLVNEKPLGKILVRR